MNPEEALQKARDAPGTDGKVVRVHHQEEAIDEALMDHGEFTDHASLKHILNCDVWAIMEQGWSNGTTVDYDRVQDRVVDDTYDVVESVEVIDYEDSLFAQED